MVASGSLSHSGGYMDAHRRPSFDGRRSIVLRRCGDVYAGGIEYSLRTDSDTYLTAIVLVPSLVRAYSGGADLVDSESFAFIFFLHTFLFFPKLRVALRFDTYFSFVPLSQSFRLSRTLPRVALPHFMHTHGFVPFVKCQNILRRHSRDAYSVLDTLGIQSVRP